MELDRIECCDCLEGLRRLPDDFADCLVTDPPYGLHFMGRSWDKVLADPAIWRECLRVLKPGAVAAVMAPARTDCLWRMMRDLEEAGFDVSLQPLCWVYRTGFPKSLSLSKSFDSAAFHDWCKDFVTGDLLDDEDAEVMLCDDVPPDALAELRALGF